MRAWDAGDGGFARQAPIDDGHEMRADGHGNLFITAGNRVRRIDAVTGVISTVAGNGA